MEVQLLPYLFLSESPNSQNIDVLIIMIILRNSLTAPLYNNLPVNPLMIASMLVKETSLKPTIHPPLLEDKALLLNLKSKLQIIGSLGMNLVKPILSPYLILDL